MTHVDVNFFFFLIPLEAGTFYFVVAIVRKSDEATTISNLKMKKSCHGGYDSVAGWKVPIGYLIYNRKILVTGCKIPQGKAWVLKLYLNAIASHFL